MDDKTRFMLKANIECSRQMYGDTHDVRFILLSRSYIIHILALLGPDLAKEFTHILGTNPDGAEEETSLCSGGSNSAAWQLLKNYWAIYGCPHKGISGWDCVRLCL